MRRDGGGAADDGLAFRYGIQAGRGRTVAVAIVTTTLRFTVLIAA